MKHTSLTIDGIELTACELQLLPLEVKGLPRKLIAAELNKTLSTVDSQLRILFAKLGIHKDKELVVWAIRNNLDTEKKIKEAVRRQRREKDGK